MDIYLDDFHLHSTTERLHTNVKRPLQGIEGGEQRITVYDNPGGPGQTVSQIFAGASLITLTGSLRAITGATDQELLDDYATARDALFNAIKFEYDSNGKIQSRTLKLTMPNGELIQATVYRHNWQAPMEYNTYGTWLLELLNESGLIESQTLSTASITIPVDGGVVYPLTYPLVYGSSSGGSTTVTNYGDATAKPIITFYGPIENPVITNQTAGQFLRLNMTIASGRKVVVDMSVPSILEGSLTGTPSTNQQDKKGTGSRYWGILPGTNTIRLAATTYDTGYATIEFRSAWTGK